MQINKSPVNRVVQITKAITWDNFNLGLGSNPTYATKYPHPGYVTKIIGSTV